MKKVLTKFSAIAAMGLLMLTACKKEGTLVTSNGGKAGTLTASTSNLALDKSKLNDTSKVINFSFSAADYGFSAAVTNTLQIDSAGDNWAKPMSVSLSPKVYSQGYSTPDFNSLLLKLNLPAGVASKINVRVQHTLSTSVAPIYSNVLSLTVTPYNLASWVYVPGAYEGWANPGPQEDSLLSATSNGIYTGIINFTAGNNQFLIVPVKNWNNKWATNDGASTSGTSSNYAVTYNGSNNFYAPSAAGEYVVTLNTNNNTISIVPANYYSIIGSVTPGGNWSTDDDLKFVNSTDQDWEGTFAFSAGQFKIRQNHDWTLSWGDVSPADGINATSANGGNINVAAAGTYKVTFKIPVTTVGNNPPQAATYSLTKQ